MNAQKILEIVATFELDPILTDDGSYSSLKFRIEIVCDHTTNLFFPKVYRWETLRVQPTFPQQEGNLVCDLADHEILVQDTGIDCDGIAEHSVKEALDKIIERIYTIFLTQDDDITEQFGGDRWIVAIRTTRRILIMKKRVNRITDCNTSLYAPNKHLSLEASFYRTHLVF
jgi:hypothetical protein